MRVPDVYEDCMGRFAWFPDRQQGKWRIWYLLWILFSECLESLHCLRLFVWKLSIRNGQKFLIVQGCFSCFVQMIECRCP